MLSMQVVYDNGNNNVAVALNVIHKPELFDFLQAWMTP